MANDPSCTTCVVLLRSAQAQSLFGKENDNLPKACTYSTPNLYLPIEVPGTPQGVVASTTCGLLQNVRIELNIAANANQHTT